MLHWDDDDPDIHNEVGREEKEVKVMGETEMEQNHDEIDLEDMWYM